MSNFQTNTAKKTKNTFTNEKQSILKPVLRNRPEIKAHQQFDQLAQIQPDALALCSDHQTLTYAHLKQQSDQMAHRLLAAGLECEQRVGVLVHRSSDLPTACLGIYKAGGIYVPLVADHPVDRLQYMLDTADIDHLIALDGLDLPDGITRKLTIVRPCALQDVGPCPALPDRGVDQAAILFTSGSTGRPKGVQISHKAITNMVFGHMEDQKINADDRILLSSSPGFILGFRELHLPFFSGACHVPVTRSQLDTPGEVFTIMEAQNVSVALFTPSYLSLFQHKVPKGLRLILSAGEKPIEEDARFYAQHLDYWNCHGTTETCGTYAQTQLTPDTPSPIPSGSAFPNAHVLLLDEDKRPVEHGQTGEIYVISQGLSIGYLKETDLTQQNFVDTPWGRAFRTHDYGQINDHGQLLSLGRSDDVVKISGQSVSLGEIAQALQTHPHVQKAYVSYIDNRLCAVLESKLTPPPTLDYWRAYLDKQLPAYMVPAHYHSLPALPVNSAGKVDRKAIKAIAQTTLTTRTHGTPPDGLPELALAATWVEFLNLKTVYQEDNFFSLGGTSLCAIKVCQSLRAQGYDLSPHTLLATPVLKEQATKVRKLNHLDLSQTTSGPASAVQADFWTAWKLGRPQAGSLITRILKVEGTTFPDTKWQTAWQQLCARHSALRTAFFETTDETLNWRTHSDLAAPFKMETASDAPSARVHIQAHFATPIALDQAPLVRGGLIRIPSDETTLFWFALHHSVVDGLSAQVLQDELYALLCDQPLAEAGNGMAQSIHQEQDYLQSLDIAQDRTYWRKTLDLVAHANDGEAFNDYALDKRRPLMATGHAATPFYEKLNKQDVSALEELAKINGISFHSLLLALLGHETRRRTGKQHVVIATGVSTQPATRQPLVGLFVNLVPTLLDQTQPDERLQDTFQKAQQRIAEVGEHARLPAAEIIADFRARHPDVRAHRATLFDLSFTANPSRYNQSQNQDCRFTPWRDQQDTLHPAAGLELAFHHEQLDDGSVELGLVWSPDVYHAETARNWLSGFANWARWLAADINRASAPLPTILPDEESALKAWENGDPVQRPQKRFDQIFTDLALTDPAHTAIVTKDKTLTRHQLETQANQIANGLLKQGVTPGDTIAVLSGINATLPAVILGIWKVGAVYLPLALDIPSDRQVYIATDAHAKLLITVDNTPVHDQLANSLATRLSVEELGNDSTPVDIHTAPDSAAYIIYTSGTTGKPKGVIIHHDGMNNAIFITDEAVRFKTDDRVAMVASAGFDASLWELGMGLLLGGALVPIDHALRDDPWAMKTYYQDMGVTIAFHAPSYVRISRDMPFNSLRALITGGETPSHEDFNAHKHELEFFNAYGPSETSIIVCITHIDPDIKSERPLPLGHPGANQVITIRDKNGHRCAPGVVGEVWLGGVGVGGGYLNKPDLTDEKFLTIAEGRFYKTGDLGRWTDEGQLELAGRIDHQVKLHGQRLELEEIELALHSLEEIKNAVVLVHEGLSGTKTLQAFARLNKGQHLRADQDWRNHLATKLPPYMIPADIHVILDIPVNSSGKLDRNKLLSLVDTHKSTSAQTPPQQGLENTIAQVWQDLLSRPVYREDNFFALGGNSLLAVTIAHRLSKQLNLKIAARNLFAAPTLSGFADKVSQCAPMDTSAPKRSDIATESEREFWTAEQAGLDTRTFTILVQQDINGAVPDRTTWDTAWAKLVSRHGALRTYYREDAQGVLRRRLAQLSDTSLTHSVVNDRKTLNKTVRAWQKEPLLMAQAPLWRAGVIRETTTNTATFWLALHHAVGDGRSIAVLMRDFAALLDQQPLAALTTDLEETGAAYNDYLDSDLAQKDRAYWQTIMAPVPDAAFDEYPLDCPRENPPIVGTHRLRTHIEATTAQGLFDIASQNQASMHALMLSLFAWETKRRTGRHDLVMGTTASSRETAADNDVVGCFVNMLPLPFTLKDGCVFAELLQNTQSALMGALQHERYPFAHIYHDVWADRPHLRHPLRFPLFDFVVTENPAPQKSEGLFSTPAVVGAALDYEFTDWPPGQDMVLIHERQPDGSLLIETHVNAEVYSKDTAEQWFNSLVRWARYLGTQPKRSQSVLPALAPLEDTLLQGWEHGPQKDRRDSSVLDLFHQQVERTPTAIAHRGVTDNLTYDQINDKALRIAQLLANKGIGNGMVVAVLGHRCADLASAMLGIWKAGCVYLPLANDLPHQRLLDMAQDADARTLFVLQELETGISASDQFSAVLHLSDIDMAGPQPNLALRPHPTAYILFTSGSTGRPKGVQVSHKALLNLTQAMIEEFELGPQDRTLMFSSPSFDVSLSDICVPLSCGASFTPITDDILHHPARMVALVNDLALTLIDITPTYLRLLNGADLPSVRIIVTGGEAPLAQDVAHYARRHAYYNAYGPTENTITTCLTKLDSDKPDQFFCGTPLANTIIEIRDENANRLAPGVVGEIWLGGDNLADGYINRPQETAAAFVQTPEGPRYRTGDLGRWHPNGQLMVLGRRDEQVKLNGIRIELSEIEHALATQDNIVQAVVVLDKQGSNSHRLIAYVKTDGPIRTLMRDLQNRLPAYMIPSEVICVDHIPTTNAGKVDKKALQQLHASPQKTQSAQTLPTEQLHKQVAAVWEKHLQTHPIHLEDNFFSLGGHSLLAISVANDLEKELDCPVPAREIFTSPTLEGFCQQIVTVQSQQQAENGTSDIATMGQQEFWTAEQAGHDTRGFNLALTLVAQNNPPSAKEWAKAWQHVLTRHPILTSRFVEDDHGILRTIAQPNPLFTLQPDHCSDLTAAQQKAKAYQSQPHSMEKGPLCRAGLITTDQADTVFWVSLNHAIADGWSLGNIAKELEATLRGYPLSDLATPFAHMQAREQAFLASDDFQHHQAFWQQSLDQLKEKDETAFDDWQTDYPRPASRQAHTSKGSHCLRITLDQNTTEKLQALAQNHQSSFHALMVALMGMEIQRRSKRKAFALGTVASRREHRCDQDALGYYINMIPIGFWAEKDDNVATLIQRTQDTLAQALKHQAYPFKQLCQDRADHSTEPRHPARMPVFDFAVTENPAIAPSSVQGDWSLTPLPLVMSEEIGALQYDHRSAGPAHDMVLIHEAKSDGSRDLILFANANLYRKETAINWLNSLHHWATGLAHQPTKAAQPLPNLSPFEAKWLEERHGEKHLWLGQTFVESFKKQVQIHAQRPAILFKDHHLSYAEIDAQTDQLARYLVHLGLRSGQTVAVLTERSAYLPQTALAIWKAGGVYMPISTSLPPERMAFMCQDADPACLIVLDGHLVPDQLSHLQTLRPQDGLDDCTQEIALPDLCPEDAAYILYTSGSTGVPKGVVISHKGWNNFANGVAAKLHVNAQDRLLLSASPSFDAWNSDIGMCWTRGAAIYPITRDDMDDIDGVQETIRTQGITHVTLPPSYLRLFNHCDFPSLKRIMTVGEPPLRDDVAYYADKLDYYNGYGPTENSGATTIGVITATTDGLNAGTPMPNTQVYILDENLDLVAPGTIGHIWTGGDSVGLGYLNQPEKTDEVFVQTSFGRLYNTGDLGRWTTDGNLEIYGRADTQVKLRGQRVELGEIEQCLQSLEGVCQAVALVDRARNGTQTLWAFATLSTPTTPDWHTHLRQSLPDYMIPTAVIVVNNIPMSLSGKVDQKALLEQIQHTQADGITRTAPVSDTEIQIAKVWSENLNGIEIACEDDFFALGGDSLRVIAVINALRNDYDCSANDLYENPTLKAFARHCKHRPQHLETQLQKAKDHWQAYHAELAAYDQQQSNALSWPLTDYYQRNAHYDDLVLQEQQTYQHILLSGATGYLGAYLVRELLKTNLVQLTALVRGADNQHATQRLTDTLILYFGEAQGLQLANDPRLNVLVTDLRQKGLGLDRGDYDHLAQTVDAIYHSAANVNHFGHYQDLYADNVQATDHLIDLAAQRPSNPADFHHISTISVAGTPPRQGFQLFSEYSLPPKTEAENYYIRTKQEAERRVIAARDRLTNATIHRVGNIVFAADNPILQKGVKTNAFFRQLASFIRVGKAPNDLHVWLCHVDYLAKALITISNSKALMNETHHLEHHYRHTVSGLLTNKGAGLSCVEECDFATFVTRLQDLIGQDAYHTPMAELIEAFGLMRGQAPQPRGRRLEVITERTQTLLTRLGFSWPEVPITGLRHLLNNAQDHFDHVPPVAKKD
ncbi:amino acid adenylation domain-containing protein [Terasakiella pusilla]|uniref:amino acid adenylation domain-containing protein n=1 Tax=Terasakiella pusilla TaxID=64973 RepID=UPI003AA83146